MNTFLNVFFKDQVMLAAGIVLAGTVGIALRALKSLNEGSSAPEEISYEDIPQDDEDTSHVDNSGLTEGQGSRLL